MYLWYSCCIRERQVIPNRFSEFGSEKKIVIVTGEVPLP